RPASRPGLGPRRRGRVGRDPGTARPSQGPVGRLEATDAPERFTFLKVNKLLAWLPERGWASILPLVPRALHPAILPAQISPQVGLIEAGRAVEFDRPLAADGVSHPGVADLEAEDTAAME